MIDLNPAQQEAVRRRRMEIADALPLSKDGELPAAVLDYWAFLSLATSAFFAIRKCGLLSPELLATITDRLDTSALQFWCDFTKNKKDKLTLAISRLGSRDYAAFEKLARDLGVDLREGSTP